MDFHKKLRQNRLKFFLALKMKKILVIHGPNLNQLGKREPNHYGSTSLTELNQTLIDQADNKHYQLTIIQSNHEGELIDAIHHAGETNTDYIIINPAALTHTSIALRDAFLSVSIPFIEVHLTNIYSREPFRHHSYLSDIAQGTICGLGIFGYSLALQAAFNSFN